MPDIAVVLLPNNEDFYRIKGMQESLREFGVSSLSMRQRLPHLTLVAGTVDNDFNARNIFHGLLSQTHSLELVPLGLGIFVLETPLIYLRWHNHPRLISLRKEIWCLFKDAYFSPNKYTKPEYWVPKISLAVEDTEIQKIPVYIEALKPQVFFSPVRFCNAAIIDYSGKKEKVLQVIPLLEHR